jgi:basic amino acid/polyamine antiporter, APA family
VASLSTAGDALERRVGLPGAVFMGLGSIVGTGIFVSLGIAAGVAGGAILLALPLAALLALASGLSSAQLAAAHPVSGGTYAYGYRFLSPSWGFAAGTTFLLAKSASAATAALGFSGYLLPLFGLSDGTGLLVSVALAGVLVLTVLTAGGITRSNQVNLLIVGITLLVLVLLVGAGLFRSLTSGGPAAEPGGAADWIRAGLSEEGGAALLHATALLFVAYTGYGRIATLGEEVRDPARTIPRAIWITLGTVALLYVGVAFVALATLGAGDFARETAATAAPLEAVARALEIPGLRAAVALAAVTAMLGVLLNLLLGLSRVAFAMGREGDLPRSLARVHGPTGSPRVAVWATGAVIAALVLIGDVRVTWAFSAFTVLLYYGITNLAALRLTGLERRYPRWVPLTGLGGCLLLAFFVPPGTWLAGGALVAGAFLLRLTLRRRAT